MAPKKTIKTLVYHPPNRRGGKKIGKEVQVQNKLQLDAAAACNLPGGKSSNKLIKPAKDPNYANFKDPVKESLGKLPGSSTPGNCPVGPDGLPFSPREDPNNKGVQAPGPKCAPQDEASICAQRKSEKMKRLAMIGVAGFLFLLLFWWLFKRSIYRFLGYPDEGDDGYWANGYGSDGYRADGYGADGYGADGAGGAGGAGKYRKKGQMCWFNLPCTYDSEEGYKRAGDKSGKSQKLKAG